MNVQDVNFNFNWKFKDYPPKNGLKVFSTFACGGGSTMGYKLAGFDVIAANDIDQQMANVYKENHKPQNFFHCSIKDLINKELPTELHDIDILDGSPPCSTFSTTGQRDKNWGKLKKFREGQSAQILDDLFFDFIELSKKIKPKIIIAENVKGMIIGNAKGYCKLINEKLKEAGYNVQLFLLNSASMNVPQSRERVFFICSRTDLNFSPLKLNFSDKQVPFKDISDEKDAAQKITQKYLNYWNKAQYGQPVGKFDTIKKVSPSKPLPTILATNSHFHYKYPRHLNKKELCLGGTFPLDYNFLEVKPLYLIGMSVQPVMIAKIANEILKQWFKK